MPATPTNDRTDRTLINFLPPFLPMGGAFFGAVPPFLAGLKPNAVQKLKTLMQ